MGRDGRLVCRDCKLEIYLGYGSYLTWIGDHANTVAGFYMAVARRGKDTQLTKNVNLRRALQEHEGHDFTVGSEDWWVHDSKRDALCVEGAYGAPGKVIAENYSEYRFEDWESPNNPDEKVGF